MPFTVLICPHVTTLTESYQIIGGTIHLVVVDVMPSQASTRSPTVWILALVAISLKDHGSEFSILEIKSVRVGSYPTLPVPMIPTLTFFAHLLSGLGRMLVPQEMLIPQHRVVENILNVFWSLFPIVRVICTAHTLTLGFPKLFSSGCPDSIAVDDAECSPGQGLTHLCPALWRPLGSKAPLIPEECFTTGTSAAPCAPVDD